MSAVKGTSRKVWLTDDDLKRVNRISDKTRLGQTALLSQIISAGLEALSSNGDTFQLPLRFQVLEANPVVRWQETEKTSRNTTPKK